MTNHTSASMAVALLLVIGTARAQCATSWQPVSGANAPCNVVLPLPDGGYVIGGNFTSIGGVAANHVARWTGSGFVPLGSGIVGGVLNNSHGQTVLSGNVYALARLPNGDILAGGNFSIAGGVFVLNCARWDGTNWSPFGGFASGVDEVRSILVLPNGNVLVGGSIRGSVYLWNGATWSVLGPPLALMRDIYEAIVNAMVLLPNGDILVGGFITTASGTPASGLAVWNGLAWQGLTSTNSSQDVVHALAVRPDGSVVVGGSLNGGSAIGFWNGGSTWTVDPSGPSGITPPVYAPWVWALHELPDGDVLAGGIFTVASGGPVRNIARLHGSSWSAVDGGVSSRLYGFGGLRDGDVMAVGEFQTAGTVSSACVARLHSTCPAFATSYGTGCSGSAGPVQLVADTLPFIGATYRSTATGFGPNSFGLWLVGGVATSIPLASILPQGGAGCDLLTNGDIFVNLQFPSAGSTTENSFTPADPALIGVVVFNQVAQVEVDASLAIVQVTTSNGLQLTIGVF